MATKTAGKKPARKTAKSAKIAAPKRAAKTARAPRKKSTPKKQLSPREQFEDTEISIPGVCSLKKGTTREQAVKVATSIGKSEAHLVSVSGAYRILSEPRPKTAPHAPKPKVELAKVEPKERQMSALDAAAKILVEAGKPLHTKALIEAMAIKGYWSSPGGKTPDATLNAAIIREIATKGDNARFVKTGPSTFEAKA